LSKSSDFKVRLVNVDDTNTIDPRNIKAESVDVKRTVKVRYYCIGVTVLRGRP